MAFDEDKPKHAGGRPPAFETPEQLDSAVTEYIANTPVGMVTITGLCMWLGFSNRRSLYDYKEKPEFTHSIEKALLAVENSYELTLRSISVAGSIFALKNMGWKDKTESEVYGKDGGPLQLQQITGMEFKDR